MDGAVLLISDISPNGNLEAFVEQDARVAYFYLRHMEDVDYVVRSCWLRNLVKAPKTLEFEKMQEGIPPLLPEQYSLHPSGAPPLNSNSLRIVWFEEGDAVAVLDSDELLGVIPGWSGTKGFHGYARDCNGESPLAWALGTPAENAMFERVKKAEEFWKSWEGEPLPWPELQDEFMELYESLGKHSNYYAIDGGEWPPKAVVRIPLENCVVLASLGICIRPMPKAEEPEIRRMELAIALPNSFSDDQVNRVASMISSFSNIPWEDLTWLGEGHTVSCTMIPDGANGTKYAAVALTASPPNVPSLKMPSYRGDKINLFWLVPITKQEQDYAMKHTTAELLEKLWATGGSWIHNPNRNLAL